jgi:hypothetical protein
VIVYERFGQQAGVRTTVDRSARSGGGLPTVGAALAAHREDVVSAPAPAG